MEEMDFPIEKYFIGKQISEEHIPSVSLRDHLVVRPLRRSRRTTYTKNTNTVHQTFCTSNSSLNQEHKEDHGIETGKMGMKTFISMDDEECPVESFFLGKWILADDIASIPASELLVVRPLRRSRRAHTTTSNATKPDGTGNPLNRSTCKQTTRKASISRIASPGEKMKTNECRKTTESQKTASQNEKHCHSSAVKENMKSVEMRKLIKTALKPAYVDLGSRTGNDVLGNKTGTNMSSKIGQSDSMIHVERLKSLSMAKGNVDQERRKCRKSVEVKKDMTQSMGKRLTYQELADNVPPGKQENKSRQKRGRPQNSKGKDIHGSSYDHDKENHNSKPLNDKAGENENQLRKLLGQIGNEHIVNSKADRSMKKTQSPGESRRGIFNETLVTRLRKRKRNPSVILEDYDDVNDLSWQDSLKKKRMFIPDTKKRNNTSSQSRSQVKSGVDAKKTVKKKNNQQAKHEGDTEKTIKKGKDKKAKKSSDKKCTQQVKKDTKKRSKSTQLARKVPAESETLQTSDTEKTIKKGKDKKAKKSSYKKCTQQVKKDTKKRSKPTQLARKVPAESETLQTKETDHTNKDLQKDKGSRKSGKNGKIPSKEKENLKPEECLVTATKGTLKYLQQRETFLKAAALEAQVEQDFFSQKDGFGKKKAMVSKLLLSNDMDDSLTITTPKIKRNETDAVITPRTMLLGQLGGITPTVDSTTPSTSTPISERKKEALQVIYQHMKNNKGKPRGIRRAMQESQSVSNVATKNMKSHTTPVELPVFNSDQDNNYDDSSHDEYFEED